jgi:hypothetical protein
MRGWTKVDFVYGIRVFLSFFACMIDDNSNLSTRLSVAVGLMSRKVN